jgi:tRNA A37 threonylcarbamoyladenosine biosynthesis protein TsaE
MESFRKAVLQIVDFIEKNKKDRSFFCLTGDFGCGKTALGNFIEKFYQDVVFVNSDYFRVDNYNQKSKNDLEYFLSSYNFILLKEETDHFLNGKDFGIYIKKNGKINKKVFLNSRSKILLLEFPFIFSKQDILPADFIIEIKNIEKKRMSSNSETSILANKAMALYKDNISDIYRSNLVVLN